MHKSRLLSLHSSVTPLHQLRYLFYCYTHRLYHSINSGTFSIPTLTGYTTLSTQALLLFLHSPVTLLHQPRRHFHLSLFLLYTSPPHKHITSACTHYLRVHLYIHASPISSIYKPLYLF